MTTPKFCSVVIAFATAVFMSLPSPAKLRFFTCFAETRDGDFDATARIGIADALSGNIFASSQISRMRSMNVPRCFRLAPVICIVFLFVAAVFLPAVVEAQGRLSSVRNSTRKKSTPAPAPKKREQPKQEKRKEEKRKQEQRKQEQRTESKKSFSKSRPKPRRSTAAISVTTSALNQVRKSTRKKSPSPSVRQGNRSHRGRPPVSRRRAVRPSRPARRCQPDPVFVVTPAPVVVHQPVITPVVHSEPVFLPQEPTWVAPAPRPTTIVPAQPPVPATLPSQAFSEPQSVLDNRPVQPVNYFDNFNDSAATLWATLGSDFDDFTRGDFGFRLQPRGGLGIETSVTNLREDFYGMRDHIWLGDVNVTYEAITRGDVRGRIGIGVNWINDGWGSSAGFNLTAGVDVRLNENWLLVSEADLGSLGDADYFHGRISLNRRFGGVEWATGLDHLDIGGVDITTGFTGIQFRF